MFSSALSLASSSLHKARPSCPRGSSHTSRPMHAAINIPVSVDSSQPLARRLVLPGSDAVVVFSLRPQKEGTFMLLASMHCDQVTDVRGWREVVVTR